MATKIAAATTTTTATATATTATTRLTRLVHNGNVILGPHR